jgi:hypothetical protein
MLSHVILPAAMKQRQAPAMHRNGLIRFGPAAEPRPRPGKPNSFPCASAFNALKEHCNESSYMLAEQRNIYVFHSIGVLV